MRRWGYTGLEVETSVPVETAGGLRRVGRSPNLTSSTTGMGGRLALQDSLQLPHLSAFTAISTCTASPTCWH